MQSAWPSPTAVNAVLAGVCVRWDKARPWLFALLPHVELYSPTACHFYEICIMLVRLWGTLSDHIRAFQKRR